MRNIILVGIVVFLGALLAFTFFIGPPVDPNLLKPAAYDYPSPTINSCSANTKTGLAGISDNIKTAEGATYNLRTPSNYNNTLTHPLIVVYAPAGTSASKSERHTHLTKKATEAGFIIAYAKNLRMSVKAIEKLASIPTDIQKKWCIDSNRIYYTGHSDGGSIANALTFLPSIINKPTAIAPSAAGMDTESLKQYACPTPLPVMVFHNSDDSHFEGFGKQAADWWANCNHCSTELTTPDEYGCSTYKNCPASSKTVYCEGLGGHSTWPNKNAMLIDFFKRSK
ncbi:MAG: poly(3-hydroxybutyrate) depolymerase [Piscirickettsiaceae bacterium]|nr:MAG: poly(3-hydroxybutyrate) depolymerase [Piscirickettsiaceae bacterium]